MTNSVFAENENHPERTSVFRHDPAWEMQPSGKTKPPPSEWWIAMRLMLLTLGVAMALFSACITGCLLCIVALLALGMDVQYAGVIGAMTAFVAAAYAWEWLRRDGLSPSVIAWLIFGGGK